MVGRSFFLGGLLLGAAAASPVDTKSAKGAEVITARGSSIDSKVDTVAGWAHEWWGGNAPALASRDLDAHNVIDKVAGWTKDWYATDDEDSVAKRAVDHNDVVDTVASWTKEWLHSGEQRQNQARATEGETVDETIDRFAGKLKSYFDAGNGLNARDLGIDFGGIIHQILGFLENLDWNSIIKFVNNIIAKIDLNPIIKGILSWIDSTFFGGSSGKTASKVASRDTGIDWSSLVQKAISFMETLF